MAETAVPEAPQALVAPISVFKRPVGTNPFLLRFWFGEIDLRGIALFRILLGLFCVYNTVDFAPDLRAWFSDEGVFPRSVMLSQWARSTRLCLLDAFGSPTLVWIYWGMALIAAVAMTLGYKSRWAAVANFVFMAGFQERIPPLFDGSDTVLRCVLFWHMFTQSGAVWSVDAVQAQAHGKPLPTVGPALPVRLTGLQIGWVYFCSVFYKLEGVKWHDGTALHYALHLTHVFAHPWAGPIGDQMWFVKLGTYFTLVIESTFIFLTHFPVKPRLAKAVALLCGAALHIGILLTINVGHFSVLMPLTYVSMFEGDWAQWVVDHAKAMLGALRIARWRELATKFPYQEPGSMGAKWVVENRSWMTPALAVWFGMVSWHSMPHPMVPDVPGPILESIEYTSMWSNWDMFAPEPLSTDYTLSAPAELEDGTTVDLLTGLQGSGQVKGDIENRGNLIFFTRWWKYMENVVGGNQTLPLEWGRYICRERNFHLQPGESRIYTFSLFKDNQEIPALGEPWPKVQRETVWTHRCFDKPSDTRSPQAEPPHPAIAIETPAH